MIINNKTAALAFKPS